MKNKFLLIFVAIIFASSGLLIVYSLHLRFDNRIIKRDKPALARDKENRLIRNLPKNGNVEYVPNDKANDSNILSSLTKGQNTTPLPKLTDQASYFQGIIKSGKLDESGRIALDKNSIGQLLDALINSLDSVQSYDYFILNIVDMDSDHKNDNPSIMNNIDYFGYYKDDLLSSFYVGGIASDSLEPSWITRKNDPLPFNKVRCLVNLIGCDKERRDDLSFVVDKKGIRILLDDLHSDNDIDFKASLYKLGDITFVKFDFYKNNAFYRAIMFNENFDIYSLALNSKSGKSTTNLLGKVYFFTRWNGKPIANSSIEKEVLRVFQSK